MAVKWAVVNGNWNAGATWNDGSVPQVGDTVYLDGHDVSANVDINLGDGIIRNDLNPQTNLSQGRLINTAQRNYVVNFIQGDAVLVYVTNSTINIVGNIQTGTSNAAPFSYFNTYTTGKIVNITGDVVVNEAKLSNGGISACVIQTMTINGNVLVKDQMFTYPPRNLLINGNLHVSNGSVGNANMTLGLIVNGNLHYDVPLLSDTIIPSLTISGNITYTGSPQIGVKDVVFIGNEYTWKDVSITPTAQWRIITDYQLDNLDQYPAPTNVKNDVPYAWGELVGQYLPDYPPESVVLKDYEYGDSDDRKTGTMVQEVNVEVGCVTPEDVRKDVPLVGMGVVGSLVVPSVDDVREGVVFDNGSVGTLIVQGGGDRLRIADFGYYTRSTSITYIVDLTESDKPAFADCEEIVLRSLFPTLDLDNIPDKFFDDLFVQFLRYRLLVEYYRGTSINSKFTPSEPTTEIVNYANTKCEYWLNTANLFLQLWGEKYPNSVKRDRILL